MVKRRLVIELQTDRDVEIVKRFKSKCALINKSIREQILKLIQASNKKEVN